MRYVFIIAFILLMITTSCSDDDRTITIKTGSKVLDVKVDIAKTPAELENGLMNVSSLDDDTGMLFVFDDDDYRSFWMKNTIIPLDIIFISSDGSIVDIKRDFEICLVEECDIYRSEKKAMYALEVNAGFSDKNGVKEGDIVIV